MKSTIKLFRVIPVSDHSDLKFEAFIEKCIPEGFIFTDDIFFNYTKDQLDELFEITKKEIGLNALQLNNSFHKSWNKVKNASLTQLYLEQIIHYYTTYGFESLGIYDKTSVYIPNEKLDLPKIDLDKISLTVIKGATKEEIKEMLLRLINSGVALKEDTIKDVIDVALFVGLTDKEIENIKNKEVKANLYDLLDITPENPTEFLRFCVYKATDNTLLIKNKVTIELIKGKKNLDILKLFKKYESKYGLDELSSIFYRFKPLFLALRTNVGLKTIINKIRRLAKKNHKPMAEDFLNTITSKLKNGKKIDIDELEKELKKANTFRKIRLAYALKFRTTDCKSILYKVRNGKGYASDFKFDNKKSTNLVLNEITDSIINDISKNVNGKKIFIPENISYALPATEKQFTGMLPSGTCITIQKDMIFGVNWNNQKENRIDLDLSLLDCSGNKYGWDANYRSSDNEMLFSGDMTDASDKNGASESFYIKKLSNKEMLFMVNYYNYDKEIPVPFNIFVAKENIISLKKNYIINPNNIVCSTKSCMDKQQKVLGIVIVNDKECKFYFSEINVGNSISSDSSDYSEHIRKYLKSFYTNTISLNEILTKAGAIMCDDKEDADIDLSPSILNKNSIIDLLS